MTPASAAASEFAPPVQPENPPPIWFLAPEGFFTLPLAATPGERAQRADSFVRDLYARGDEDIWNPASPYYAGVAELLMDTGVSYAAIGLFSTSEEDHTPEGDVLRHDLSEGAAQCAFTLAAIPTDQAEADTDIVAQGILATLSKDQYNEVHWLDLPCGPAVACATWRQFQIDPETAASSDTQELVTAQLQVHVPFPTGPFTAVFTLLTAYVDNWPQFCELMGAILQTVSFIDPTDVPTDTTDH